MAYQNISPETKVRDSLETLLANDRSAHSAPPLPTIRPSLNLDFANARSLDPRVGFARASTATYFDASGVLRTAAMNEPRIGYDPVTGGHKGLLVERQATNLFIWSNDFTKTVWVKSDATVVAGSVPAPDGAMMTKLVESATAAEHYIVQSASAPPLSTVWMGVFVKAGERKKVRLGTMIFAGQESRTQMDVDLTTGHFTLSGTGDYEGRVTDVGNGIYLAQVRSVRNDGSHSSSLRVTILNDNGEHIYQGDGVSGIYIAHAQLEESPFPTSYIPTEGSQVTRAAELPSAPISISSQGATFVTDVVVDADFTVLANDRRHLFSLSDDNWSTDIAYVYLESRGLYSVHRVNGSALKTTQVAPFTPVTGERYRIAVTIDGNVMRVCVNGTAVASGETILTLANVTKLHLGYQPPNFRQLMGKMARFVQYPRILPDSELQELTS